MRTMSRESPQTERILLLMDMLSEEPAHGRTLAEIARHLGVAKATCYPMVIALADAGWLVRHPKRKTYQLGPALVPIGRAAASAVDVVDMARPLMHGLTDAAAMSCVCFVPSGDDLVVAEIVQPVGGRRGTLGLRVGDKVRVAPPLGSMLTAWTGPDRREQWYRRGAEDLGVSVETLSATYDPILALIRERGYSVECLDPPSASVADVVSEMRHVGVALGRQHPATALQRISSKPVADILIGVIDPGQSYRPISINAAGFNADGSTAVILCLVDASAPVAGGDVIALGERVRSAAEELTGIIGGRRPDTDHP
jgi:DNA-binding IclR family transcriptional regulator